MNALDSQLATNLKKIDATKAKVHFIAIASASMSYCHVYCQQILESSKAMWQANFVKMQQQSKYGMRHIH